MNFSTILELQQKVFRVLTRSFRQRGHNCILHVHRNILRKFIFLSKNSFFSVVFGIWAATLSIFGEMFLVGLSKLHSPLLENHSCWKKHFCSKNCTFILFGIWASFSTSCRQCYRRLAKVSIRMFRRTFQGIALLENLWIFHQFRNSSKKFSEFWREIFGRVVTTAFYMYVGTFWAHLFSFRKLPNFFPWFSEYEQRICGFFGEFFLLQKHSWCKKQFCSKNCMFVSFEICESFSSSCQQCYGRLAKISLCMFRRSFQRITFLESAQLFHPYRNSSKIFQSSDENFLTGWSQLDSTCTKAQFEYK